MIPFDDAHRAVHYPKDRRFRIWIRPSILILLIVLASCPFVLAWVQHAILWPAVHRALACISEGAPSGPHGFPVWIRWSHFFNLIFLFMLIRSGLSILMDHPRLYLNDHCTPGTEWIRFTPLRVPKDRFGRPRTTRAISRPSLRCQATVIRWGSRAPGISSTFMGLC